MGQDAKLSQSLYIQTHHINNKSDKHTATVQPGESGGGDSGSGDGGGDRGGWCRGRGIDVHTSITGNGAVLNGAVTACHSVGNIKK